MPPSTLLFSRCFWQGSRAACLGKFYGQPTSTLSCRPWKSTADVVWDAVEFFALEKKSVTSVPVGRVGDTLFRFRRVDVVIFLWFKWTGRQSTFYLSKLITTVGKVQDGWWMQMLSEGVTLRPTWKVNPSRCLSKKQRLAHSETPESRLGEFFQARRPREALLSLTHEAQWTRLDEVSQVIGFYLHSEQLKNTENTLNANRVFELFRPQPSCDWWTNQWRIKSHRTRIFQLQGSFSSRLYLPFCWHAARINQSEAHGTFWRRKRHMCEVQRSISLRRTLELRTILGRKLQTELNILISGDLLP